MEPFFPLIERLDTQFWFNSNSVKVSLVAPASCEIQVVNIPDSKNKIFSLREIGLRVGKYPYTLSSNYFLSTGFLISTFNNFFKELCQNFPNALSFSFGVSISHNNTFFTYDLSPLTLLQNLESLTIKISGSIRALDSFNWNSLRSIRKLQSCTILPNHLAHSLDFSSYYVAIQTNPALKELPVTCLALRGVKLESENKEYSDQWIEELIEKGETVRELLPNYDALSSMIPDERRPTLTEKALPLCKPHGNFSNMSKISAAGLLNFIRQEMRQVKDIRVEGCTQLWDDIQHQRGVFADDVVDLLILMHGYHSFVPSYLNDGQIKRLIEAKKLSPVMSHFELSRFNQVRFCTLNLLLKSLPNLKSIGLDDCSPSVLSGLHLVADRLKVVTLSLSDFVKEDGQKFFSEFFQSKEIKELHVNVTEDSFPLVESPLFQTLKPSNHKLFFSNKKWHVCYTLPTSFIQLNEPLLVQLAQRDSPADPELELLCQWAKNLQIQQLDLTELSELDPALWQASIEGVVNKFPWISMVNIPIHDSSFFNQSESLVALKQLPLNYLGALSDLDIKMFIQLLKDSSFLEFINSTDALFDFIEKRIPLKDPLLELERTIENNSQMKKLIHRFWPLSRLFKLGPHVTDEHLLASLPNEEVIDASGLIIDFSAMPKISSKALSKFLRCCLKPPLINFTACKAILKEVQEGKVSIDDWVFLECLYYQPFSMILAVHNGMLHLRQEMTDQHCERLINSGKVPSDTKQISLNGMPHLTIKALTSLLESAPTAFFDLEHASADILQNLNTVADRLTKVRLPFAKMAEANLIEPFFNQFADPQKRKRIKFNSTLEEFHRYLTEEMIALFRRSCVNIEFSTNEEIQIIFSAYTVLHVRSQALTKTIQKGLIEHFFNLIERFSKFPASIVLEIHDFNDLLVNLRKGFLESHLKEFNLIQTLDCPLSLESINLFQEEDVAFFRSIKKLKNLKFTLSGNENFDSLFTSLKTSPLLKFLDEEGPIVISSFRDSNKLLAGASPNTRLEALLNILGRFQELFPNYFPLTHVHISNLQHLITDEHLEKLKPKNRWKMTDLFLKGMEKISDKGLLQFLDEVKELKKINLTGCKSLTAAVIPLIREKFPDVLLVLPAGLKKSAT